MPEEDLSTKITIAQVAHLADELAGKQGEISAGPGISISGAAVSVRADGSTIGFDSSGALVNLQAASGYTAGQGVSISGHEVSVNADNETIGFTEGGALSCMLDGGPGIDVSDGGISLTSNALAQVPQILPSGGYVARGGDSSGGYFYAGLTSATMGAAGSSRVMAGSNTATVKTNTSTGLFLSGNTVRILTNGASRFIASGTVTYVYGQTTAGAIMVSAYGSSGSVKVKKNNGSYEEIITESSYATSNTPGIVQPDNSTCEVVNGGILSVKPPTLTWHIADGGSMVSAPETSNAALTKVFINGMLAQPDEDYSIAEGMITLSVAVSSGGKITTEVYSSGGASVQDGGRGVNMTRSAAPEADEESEAGE